MLKSLNLSFSNKCPATCVFCPKERGTFDNNYMKPELVKKLMQEVSPLNEIRSIQVGENGEAFTSPYIIENLRIIREYMPDVNINLTTNMSCIKKEQADKILREKLLDGLQTNIDGHDAKTYKAQKGISYKKVMKNLKMFLELRAQLNPEFPMGINVLPLAEYCNKVFSVFGKLPIQAPNHIPISTYKHVEESLREKDWFPDDVYIRESPSFFWAEREMEFEFDYNDYQCPQLPRIENEAFISPSGWWYPCCFDSNQDQAYGNINESSLVEIYNSKERSDFIDKLKNNQFEEIGYPCSRVPFCEAKK